MNIQLIYSQFKNLGNQYLCFLIDFYISSIWAEKA